MVPGIVVSLQLLKGINEKSEEYFGNIPFSIVHLPYDLDRDNVRAIMSRVVREVRKKKPKSNYEVGFGKPPLTTRFTSNQNPRSKKNCKDPWAVLSEELNKNVKIGSKNGKTIKIATRELCFRQLFRQALDNKPRARAQIRKYIILLSEREMLSPPPRARRFRTRRTEFSPQTVTIKKAMEVMIAPGLKRDIVNSFTRRYGQIPEFITDYERSLPKLDEIEGWAELKATMDQARQARETIKSAPVPELDAPPSPMYPTRQRARTTPSLSRRVKPAGSK